MTNNLPPLPKFEKWLRSVCLQAPPDHAQDLARSAWYASDKQASADCEAMAEEIERLQKALAFWMPDVPSTDHPLYKRVANDVYLLAGYDGPNNEPSAFELGHVVLAALAKAQSCVPAGWVLVPKELTAEMRAAAKPCTTVSQLWESIIAASPQPQPEQQDPDCPRCGNNRQVWTNQISGEKTCHRVDCHTVVPLTQEEIAEAESDRAIPSGRVFNIRAAFEDWYSDGGKYPKAVECKPGDPLSYILLGAQSSWGAWFAGVKALEAWIAEGRAPNAQQAEAQEPCAWAIYWGDGGARKHSVHFEFETAEQVVSEIRSFPREIRPLFSRPKPAQLQALSEEEVRESIRAEGMMYTAPDLRVAKAIQSALAAKNGAVLAAAAMAPEEAE